MSAALPPPPPKLVPTLTDVVGFSLDGESEDADAALAQVDPVPRSAEVMQLRPVPPALAADAADAVNEAELTQRVLVDVQRQIDRMFEFRMRESVGPVFAKLLDAFLIETREELNRTLHDVVRRAVAQELARHRPR
jgi:hypothetical protein